jgi:SOS response regulatory protein OraA/RecX
MDNSYLLLKRGYPQSDIAPAIQMIDNDADDHPD